MVIALERRLRKLEKAEEAKMEKLVVDHEELRRREERMKFALTPEGRAAAEASAERMLNGMKARDRARLEAVTAPEPLARLRKQWAEEDARDERIRAENKRVDAWIESLGGHQEWMEMYCTPGGPKYRGGDKAETLDEHEGE